MANMTNPDRKPIDVVKKTMNEVLIFRSEEGDSKLLSFELPNIFYFYMLIATLEPLLILHEIAIEN